MSRYKKKPKAYNVTYDAVDPLLPEMRKKVELAFDILFDAVLNERCLARFTQSADSTEAARPE